LSAADCDVSGSKSLPSLRSRFSWTFAGNALYAASQWLILVFIARLGGTEMLGQYALAVAVVAPIAMLSHLNLRAVAVTDVQGRHTFAEYLGVRLWTTGAGLAAVIGTALLSGRGAALGAAIVLAGTGQAAEAVSDLYYAFLQRRERMDRIAWSMILRGALSAGALGVTLWMTRDLLAGMLALALGRAAVLLGYDRRASAGGGRPRWNSVVFRSAVPLGVVLMLGALNTNLPRYAIEWWAGTRDLGIFAAVASFVTIGATSIHALGQAASPRMARAAGQRDAARFRKLALEVSGAALLLGALGVAVALAAGEYLLAIVYRPEYGAYGSLLAGVMAAAIAQYVAITLGYALTSARSFGAQIPLLGAAAATTAAASFLLTPRLGLAGAAVALGAAGCVQTAGAAWLLRGVLRRMEGAA
jgi:O-antigen/teichoic acid export membrane protein